MDLQTSQKRTVKRLACCGFAFSLFLQSGCAPVAVVGAGTALGMMAAEDRGIEGVVSDTSLRTKINIAWLQNESRLIDMVTLSVQNGRVLLTGIVPTALLKRRAAELLKGISGIHEIINEIEVGPGASFGDYSRDAWTSGKVRLSILSDSEVASRNYSIQTVNGVVYLMGIAQSKAELADVIDHASRIPGVKRVISYVAIKKPPRSSKRA
jgi:osmotically-inducible protein OsmY